MSVCCPHCGGSLTVTVGAPPQQPPIQVEEWLDPQNIAYRLGVSEGYVRKLCQRGHRLGISGVRKPGGRWEATTAAIADLRDS